MKRTETQSAIVLVSLYSRVQKFPDGVITCSVVFIENVQCHFGLSAELTF